MFDVTVRVCVFVVAIFAVVAKTFVVVNAFEAYKLFVKERVDKFETCQTLTVPTFAVVANTLVVNTFVVVKAFEAYKLPVTLIPVTPDAGVTTTLDATTLP
jgi:hypothetical protein